MGISSDGQICYGIAFDEDYQFPWLEERNTDNGIWKDHEDWWLFGVCGYKPPFELYEENGAYLNNIEPSKEQKQEYHQHHCDFRSKHPMPVEILMHCSYSYPMYIIAAIGTLKSNCRGFVTEIKPLEITIVQHNAVVNFCEEYCQPTDGSVFPKMKPAWLLSSIMG